MIQSLIDHSIAIADKHIARTKASARRRDIARIVRARWEKLTPLQKRLQLSIEVEDGLSETDERMQEVRCEQAREARYARRGL